MKYTLLLFTLCLLLAGCSKVPSDAEIRKEAIGAWKPDASYAESITVNSDGSILTKLKNSGTNDIDGQTMTGTWRIDGGFMIVTVPNDGGAAPDIESNKIIHIDDHEWIIQEQGDTNLTILHKP